MRAAVILLLAATAAWTSGVPALAQTAESRESARAPFAEKYLKAGLAAEAAGDMAAARSHLLLVLERSPRHVPGLVALARVEKALDLRDASACHAAMAVETFEAILDPLPEERALSVEARALLESLDPRARKADALLGPLPKMLLDDARAYMRRGLSLPALKALERLRALRGGSAEVEDLIAKIRRTGGDDVAVEDALGGEDPLKGVSQAWVEREDAAHRTWEKAYVKETEHYAVRTNAGFEMLETVALVMEPLHAFYRSFYGIEASRKVPRVEVRVYAEHAEFVATAPESMKTSGGYFTGSSIVTYDPRPTGGAMGSLIETLAHEASHQFTSLISRGWQPPWMNEGTATYFEGTTLLSNRNVRMNLVPRHSGRLETFTSHRRSPERFDLRTLLTTAGGLANYTGVHYAYGWALIYFLWNFEDEEGGNPFREPLRARMTEGFRAEQDGAAHASDFEERIVKAAKVAGVTDLRSFEGAWQRFIDDLAEIHGGRRDPAERDLAKARAIAAGKNRRAALPIYERVLARRPEDPDVLFESGLLAHETGAKARAAHRMALFLEHAEGRVDSKDQRLRKARDLVGSLDHEFLRRRKTESETLARHFALAAEYRDAGFPMLALRTLDRARILGRRLPEIAETARAVRRATGATLRTWRLLFNERDVREWTWADAADNTWRVEGEDLVSEYTATTTGPKTATIHTRQLFSREPARGDFAFSAGMKPDAAGCELLGVCFGIAGGERFQAIVVLPKSATIDVAENDGGAWRLIDRRAVDPVLLADWFTLRIELRGERLVATLADRTVVDRVFPDGAARGRFGVLMGGGKARFRHLRIFEPDPDP